MPHFRKDPLSDRWVIFAEGRDERPNEYRLASHRRSATSCPFCAGHEEETPEAIATYDRNGKASVRQDWLVRVVPNKFPALEMDRPERDAAEPSGNDLPDSLGPPVVPIAKGGHVAERHFRTVPVPPFRSPEDGQSADLNGIYETCPAIGSHEVVVESPRHVASISELTDDEARLTVLAYRDRLADLRQKGQARYALVFKNVGPEAGASLEHSHSQIAATPMVPVEVQRELTAAEQLYSAHGKCVYCLMLEQERSANQRFVDQSTYFAAFCPFASRTPYETWILPRCHASHFEQQQPEQLTDLAQFLKRIIKKLEFLHAHLAYNFFIHTAPFDTLALHHYHWHIEIIPRLTATAGFEWGAGYFINPVLPEEAAKAMRA